MKYQFLATFGVAGLAFVTGVSPANATLVLDSLPSPIGTSGSGVGLWNSGPKPTGIPLSPKTIPLKIDSLNLALYRSSGAVAVTNSYWDLNVSIYEYSDPNLSVTTTTNAGGRTFILPANSPNLIASTKFTMRSTDLSTSLSSVLFDQTTFTQSSTGQSIFSTILRPNKAYLMLFSNPTNSTDSTNANTAATGNNTYFLSLRGTSGALPGSVTNYFNWRTSATLPCDSGTEKLSDALSSCRFSTVTYPDGSAATLQSNQLFLEINATDATAPAPLPVIGGALAFSTSRRIRRRIKSASTSI